ncbi:MAG: TRAP transporter large permease [Thermodesulfobacteriota bacterium]|nr:TRAP transporter large permease [Thermodesulfobacteriota bacterium]
MIPSILACFFTLMIIGMPVGFALGLSAVFGFLKMDDPVFMTMLSQRFFSAMNSYVYLALPLFLLAGDIMNKAGLTERIVGFSNLIFGRLRGGLAQVNISTSIIFGGISGSAVADTAALGSVFIPSMNKEGYDTDFSVAVTAASSVIAPILPPSIVMVVYGGLMGVSIAGLFAAGVVPGFLIAFGMMILTRFISKKRNYPQHREKITLRRIKRETSKAIWALFMPVIILGGILGGVFTPTEAAAVAVGYALFLGFVVYRNVSLRDLYQLLFKNSVMMGVLILILSGAAVLAWLFAIEQVPQTVAELFTSFTDNRYILLLLINILMLIVGMFMDILSSLIILGPILAPMAISLGVDPLHFGMMMCVNLSIAMITPPVGGCLFIGMVVGKISFGEMVRAIWPYILVELLVLLMVIYVPDITMLVPRLLGFTS